MPHLLDFSTPLHFVAVLVLFVAGVLVLFVVCCFDLLPPLLLLHPLFVDMPLRLHPYHHTLLQVSQYYTFLVVLVCLILLLLRATMPLCV